MFIPFDKSGHKFQYGSNSISIFFERENADDVSTESNGEIEEIVRSRNRNEEQARRQERVQRRRN